MRYLAPILVVAGFLSAAVPAADSAPGLFPYDHRTEVLPNGLKCILVKLDNPDLVAYLTIARTGSRDEIEPGHTGFAHFFEHMMFHGTPQHPRGVYEEILTGIGADDNAFTGDDATCYHLVFPRRHLETVIALEADRFMNLTYAEPEFRKEALAVLGEYHKGRASPWFQLEEKFLDAAFTAHTYKHTTMGFLADIEDMPNQYAYSRQFFERFYRPDNCVVLVAGDIDFDATLALLRTHYAAWRPGAYRPAYPSEPAPQGERACHVDYEGASLPLLWIGYPAPAFDPQGTDFAALTLLARLFFGETSALHRELVLEQQRVESIEGEISPHRDPHLLRISARVKRPGDMAAVRARIEQAIAEARDAPVDAARLAALKSHLKYGFLMRLDSTKHTAMSLFEIIQLTGGIEELDRWFATLDRVTPADIQAAARRYLVRERRTIGTLASAGTSLAAPATTGAAALGAAQAGGAETDALASDAAEAGGAETDAESAAGEVADSAFVWLPNPDSPFVSFRIWIRSGSADDPPGKEGLAQLTASLIAQGGTQRQSYDAILQALYPLAARYQMSVDREMTVLQGTAHRDHRDAFYALLRDALFAPAWNAEDFARLRTDQVNALETEMRFGDDEELAKAVLHWMAYEGTSYAHPEQGLVQSVSALTLDDVRAFYGRHYTRADIVVGLAGGFDDALVARIRADLARLPATPALPPALPPATPPAPAPPGAGATAPAPPARGLRVTIIEKESPSTTLCFGHPFALTRADDDFYPLMLANSWLGEHRNSSGRLYQAMRAARGMNYGDYSYIEWFDHGGWHALPPPNHARHRQMFEVWIRPVVNARRHFALRQALREVALLTANGLREDDLRLTRSFLLDYSLNYAPSEAVRLGYAIDDRFYGLPESHLARIQTRLRTAGREQIHAALRRHIRPGEMDIVFVTADAAALKEALVSNAPSPIDYASATPEEILEEDRAIQGYPVPIAPENVRIIPVAEVFER